MAQHCSLVEPKHLSVDANIYAQVEVKYISMKEDLQLGKLKENCLLLKLYRKFTCLDAMYRGVYYYI